MTEPRPHPRSAGNAAWWLLAILAAWILWPFLSAIAWACVLAHVTWPVHARIGRRLRAGPTWHAAVSTSLVALAAMAPLAVLALAIRDDVAAGISWGSAALDRDVADVLDTVARLPLIGRGLHDWFDGQAIATMNVRDLLHQWTTQVTRWLVSALGDIGRNVLRFGLMLCFLFLLYAHGERVVAAVRTAAGRVIGGEADRWLEVCARANRAVVVSMLLTALIQGAVAGAGYWLFGLGAPALLGLATAVATLLPVVGTLLVWGPLSAFLLASGHVWPALGLAAWGTFLIHPIDNILRPWLVSGAVRLPFLLVFLGVVGGLAGMGLIGIVLGPMVLAVAWEAVRGTLRPAEPAT